MYIIDHSTGGGSYGGHRVDRGRVGEENREPAACPTQRSAGIILLY